MPARRKPRRPRGEDGSTSRGGTRAPSPSPGNGRYPGDDGETWDPEDPADDSPSLPEGSRLPEEGEEGGGVFRDLADLREGRLDPRTVPVRRRRAMLAVLADGSRTTAELASLFGRSPDTIRRDMRAVREEVGREVGAWTPAEVIGQVARAAETSTAKALKRDDAGLAWTIQRDFARLLREFGIVGRDEEREGIRLTVEAIGEGYERARAVLGVLDPRLTGQEVPEEHPPPKRVDALPLPREVGEDPPSSGDEEEEDAGE